MRTVPYTFKGTNFIRVTVRHFNTDAEHLNIFKWFFDMEHIFAFSDILENVLYVFIICDEHNEYV